MQGTFPTSGHVTYQCPFHNEEAVTNFDPPPWQRTSITCVPCICIDHDANDYNLFKNERSHEHVLLRSQSDLRHIAAGCHY